MTGIEAVKLGDHREFSVPYQPGPDCRISNSQWSVSRLRNPVQTPRMIAAAVNADGYPTVDTGIFSGNCYSAVPVVRAG
jgi:hypothetical protein